MPELPEVEVTRLSFADRIASATISDIRVGKPLRWPLGIAPKTLIGRQVLGVRRRGKYLLMDLNKGLILWHLGMSGSLSFSADGLITNELPQAHDHFDLFTTQGLLRLNDPRRFGAVVYTDSEASVMAQKLLGRLGVEPLGDEFDLNNFHKNLKQRSTAIKNVLLAGDIVVGVGNIYASEALFLAGIRPTVRSNRISRARAEKLRSAIVSVLTRAVIKGGSTLRDFSNADGQTGYFQLEANVYDRAGQPCNKCSGLIKRIVQGQRATYFCARCQKP
ncbi:MAG: bifunctional DNA-formamidopyrimidine glycosylase/DNA-(apurinic or apyrimidinic site) lyase [Burkholderiales bacterium]|nr:bifunctional DNA-formamidopyrimidine glycosylase/DNA-(apurinic or apyrimidinic site) lyase [Burkholderiales bacterium]